jgi:hypothetical protein
MVCRGMLLMLQRAGQITLPPVSYVPHNRWQPEHDRFRCRLTPRLWKTRCATSCRWSSSRLGGPRESPLFDSLMEEYHYLGYEQPSGRTVEVSGVGARPAGGLCGMVERTATYWCARPLHRRNAEARRSNIRFIAYSTRFLVLPWVRVEHLASPILGRMVARVSEEWQRIYGHPIYFLETFADPEQCASDQRHAIGRIDPCVG